MASGERKKDSFMIFLGDSHRKTADIAAGFLLEHPEHFDEALELSLADMPLISMRAARVIQMATVSAPELAVYHLGRIVTEIGHLKEQGAQRSLLKLLIPYVGSLDDTQLGILADLCFNWIGSAGTPPAIHVYALEILYGISQRLPGIKPELAAFLQHRNEERSPGIKSRNRVILEKLYREIL